MFKKVLFFFILLVVGLGVYNYLNQVDMRSPSESFLKDSYSQFLQKSHSSAAAEFGPLLTETKNLELVAFNLKKCEKYPEKMTCHTEAKIKSAKTGERIRKVDFDLQEKNDNFTIINQKHIE